MKLKEFLTEDNWAQGNGHFAPQSGFCLETAITQCYASDKSYFRIKERIDEHLGKPAHLWNDTPGRTFKEVHALLVKLDI